MGAALTKLSKADTLDRGPFSESSSEVDAAGATRMIYTMFVMRQARIDAGRHRDD